MEVSEAKNIINDFIKVMKPVFIVLENDEINANLKKVEIEAFEIVLQVLEKLQKENEKYRSGELLTANQVKSFEETTKKYYIHKDKIKEKIEEIKSWMNDDCLALHEFQREAQIDVLQELLKGE